MGDSRGIRAGRAFVELSVRDRLSAGLKRAQRRLKAFGAGIKSLGLRVAALGGVIAAPLAASVKIFTSAGDALEKMSRRTGVTVEALSKLGFAAEQSGADLETLEKGVRTMQRAVNDLGRGLSTQVDAFGDLGLAIEDLDGLSPEEQFKRIAESLSRVKDASKRAAIAQQIFGRAGTRLLPLMQDGAAGIEALQMEARRLGLTISTETAKDAAELTDAMNIVRRVMKITAITIGSALAPALKSLADHVTRIVVAANEWIKQNKQLVLTAAKVAIGIAGIGAALITTGLLLALTGAAFGGLATIAAGVSTVLGLIGAALGALLSPIGLVTVAVVGAGVALLRFSGIGSSALEFLAERFATLSGIVTKTLGGIRDALSAGEIQLAARVLWNGLRLIWLEGTDDIRSSLNVGLDAMQLAFFDAVSVMSRLWTRFASGVQSVWEKTVNAVAKGVTVVLGVFDSSLDVAAANRQLDQESEANLRRIEDKQQRSLDKIEADRKRNEAGVFESSRERFDERRQALEDARRELDRAIEDARNKREAAGADGSGAPSFTDRFRDLEDQLGAIGEGIARRIETRGTFNAAAVQGLASGGAEAERTAKATEQTARNTKRLLEQARVNGLTFG